MNNGTTAIICAFNEEKTILNIIKNVCQTNVFNQVIVINDGSLDNTGKIVKEIAMEFEIIDIHWKENKGKGFAMAKGVELANTEYLVFIDADLSNFTTAHAHKLLNSLLDGSADMVLGQPSKTFIPSKVNPFVRLTGQRSLKKSDFLPILKEIKSSRFGVETLLNLYYKSNEKRVKLVYLENLKHPNKFQKTDSKSAIVQFIQEAWQIIVAVFTNYKILIPNRNVIINYKKL
jgi:polyisoprenyl-phosphate glycosyltransferase